MYNREWVAKIAGWEADYEIAWKTHESRILDYFFVSTGSTAWTKKSAMQISWCTYFVHWVITIAGVRPLPKVGTSEELKSVGGSVGRFWKGEEKTSIYRLHPVYKKNYLPQRGDLYYLNNAQQHVGIIEYADQHTIWTVDGNSGPSGWHAKFDMTYGKKIGYGFIYRPVKPKKLSNNDFYIEIPD